MENFHQNYSLAKNYQQSSNNSNKEAYLPPDIDLEGGTLINIEQV